MNDFFQLLASNQVASNVISIVFVVVALSVTLIYVVAFFQGRDVSFWPPNVGKRPDNPATSSSPSIPRRYFIPIVIGTPLVLTTGWLIGRSQSPNQQQSSDQQQGTQNSATVTWQMDTFLSDSAGGTILYEAPKMVCERIKTMSGKRFIIDLDRSGRTEEILNDVNAGKLQCGYNGIYYANRKFKVLYFGCAIPFGLTPQEQNAWLYYKKDSNPKSPTFMQSIYSRLNLNVIAFPAGATGGQAGGWFREEVRSVNDFKGKTMRIPGFGAEVLQQQEFGVKTHDQFTETISIKESIERLKDGRFDAVEWTGPHDDLILGIDRVAKYYYYPGWWEPSTTFEVQVNMDAWNKLSPEFQEIFKAACAEVHMSILAQYTQRNSEALQQMKEDISQSGIKLERFSNEILQAAREGTVKLLDGYAEQDEDFKYVYDEWRAFARKIRGWSQQNQMEPGFLLNF